MLPVGLLAPPFVHLAYREPWRAAGALVGSTLMMTTGAVIFHFADPRIFSHDCSTPERPDRQCDEDIAVGAMLFAALWAVIDVTNTAWNPRPAKRTAWQPAVSASGAQRALSAKWSF